MAAPPNNSNAEKLVQNLWDSVVWGGGGGAVALVAPSGQSMKQLVRPDL